MVEKDTSQLEPVLISTPPVCHKCLKTKAEAEHESRLNYTNQVLLKYIGLRFILDILRNNLTNETYNYLPINFIDSVNEPKKGT